ncbi:MAG: hypothetical protein U0M42_03075 [Acutalibacteraceae bacterium]|nr:hypothetical protein [Acutalibacteraceae bacterium]
MMKKLLSILLALCMLFSMFVLPAAAVETVENGTYEHYWSIDFSEDKLYTDYDNPVKPAGHDYDFIAKNTGTKVSYANFNGMDSLYLYSAGTKGNMDSMIVPLQEDGTPIIIEPGKQYGINIEYYIARFAACWERAYLSVYSMANDIAFQGVDVKDADGNDLNLDGGGLNSHGSFYGSNEIAYWDSGRDVSGTYLDYYKLTTADGVNTFTLGSGNYGDASVNANGVKQNFSKVSTITTKTVEELAAFGVTKNADGSYTYSGKVFTEYFGFALPTAYNGANCWYQGYDEKAPKNLQDAEGNWYHNGYAEYYITKIEVYEKGVGTVEYNEGNGNVVTKKGTAGEVEQLYVPTAVPAGKYFTGWYTDAACTTAYSDTKVTFAEGAPLKLYAGYKDYLASVTNDYSTKTLAQTAISNNNPLEVPFVYGGTYYAQTNGGGWADVVATDSGIKSYPKAVDGKPAGTITVSNTTLNGKSLSPFVLKKLNGAGETVNTANTKAFGDGTYATSGWGENSFLTVYREDGTPFVVKPNTSYNITITYKVEHFSDEWQNVGVTTGSFTAVGIGYSKSNAATWATTTNNKSLVVKGTEIDYDKATDGFVTETYTVASSAADFVPVIGVTMRGMGVIGKKTEQVDGNGFPIYQVIDAPAITIKDIKVEEVATIKFIYASGSTTEVDAVKGEKIAYPKLVTATKENMYDAVWSLSADEYVAVPEISDGTALNIYELQRTDYMSFESYNQSSLYVNNKWLTNAMLSNEIAYEGSTSMKYENTNLSVIGSEPADWATNWKAYYSYNEATDTFTQLTGDTAPDFVANKYYKQRLSGELEQGMFMVKGLGDYAKYSYNYKITFKYCVPEDNTYDIRIDAYQINTYNIWGITNPQVSATYIIPKTATGGWVTGTIVVSATDAVAGNSMGQAIAFRVRTTTDTRANARNCVVYFDDIKTEALTDNTLSVTYKDSDGKVLKTVTDGLTADGAYAIDYIPSAPAGKYFKGWSRNETGTNMVSGATITLPTANQYGKVSLYAVWGDYADTTEGKTYTLGAGTKFGIAHYNGTTYRTDINEGMGWSGLAGSSNGAIMIGKGAGGSVPKWNPANTGGTSQTDSASDLIADATNLAVGETKLVGWGVGGSYTVRDENGNVLIAKPNTKYIAVINYEVGGYGSMTLHLGAGKKAAYLDKQGFDVNVWNQCSMVSAEELQIWKGSLEATAAAYPKNQNLTQVFSVTTPEAFDKNDVPVFTLYACATGAAARRIEKDANGVESYVVTNASTGAQTTYYPYEYVDHPHIYVSSITLIEVESGEGAATYTTYDSTNGYDTTVSVGKTGTSAYKATNNPDNNWYYEKEAIYPISPNEVIYGSGLSNYWNADYMMAPEHAVASENCYFGSEMTNKFIEKDGKLVPVIYFNTLGYEEYYDSKGLDREVDKDINSKDYQTTEAGKLAQLKDHYNKPTQIFRMGKAVDGHTYKVSFSIKADKIEADMSVHFASGIQNNIWGVTSWLGSFYDIKAEKIVAGETWYDFTYYITYDAAANKTTAVAGFDDSKEAIREYFYIYFNQTITSHDTTGCDNQIYFADFEYVDLGAAVGKGGASVLKEADNGRQAMRFYFSYETDDGSTIKLGDEEFEVVERGFVYTNGAIGKYTNASGQYTGLFRPTNNNGTVKYSAKTENFNECWSNENGVMTFSTYVKGFTESLMDSKLIVKGYVTFKDANGKLYTVYSENTNRSVNGIIDAGSFH